MNSIRLLNPDEIEVRVAEVKAAKNGRKYVSLLLYKTSRTDMALLDETFGTFNWKDEYQEIKGSLYCTIWVRNPDGGEWIGKQSNGTESNMEATKGEASDALKRAGFLWGIGRELYTSPQIKVWDDKCEISENNGKLKCFDRFSVSDIEYKENSISKLVITNSKGEVCYTYPAKSNVSNSVKKEATKKPSETPCCERCGNPIESYTFNGKNVSVESHIRLSRKKFDNHVYCIDCINGAQESA